MTRIESFSLTVRMDATLTVNGDNWVKPGAEGTITWKGHEWREEWQDPVPTADELAAAFKLIQREILSPVLEEVIEASTRRVAEVRRGS